MSGGKKTLISVILLFAILSFSALALEPNQLISNSADWQDVYSTMLYGKLQSKPAYFLVSSRHSTMLLNQLSTSDKNVWVINSKKNPYIISYKGLLQSKGFEVEELTFDNANLELARRLEGISNFIILDDSYGYNAISVAPYAVLSNSYVLFANRRNINQIYAYLNSIDVDSVIIYGQVDREVKDRLSGFDPKIISNGDRFEDNQEIVDMYQDLHIQMTGEPKTQVILTNGEFIEAEILSGVEPVVFIGRSNVPEQVRDYITNSDIKIGILIGNELIGSATFIRRQLGISVFVKFAQSARSPTGPISAVEDLDRFPLPRYILGLDIYSVRYNKAANKLYVTYQNLYDLSAYLSGTITLRYGGESQTVGDDNPIFIDKGEYKTIVYDVDPIDADSIEAEVFTIYGESKNSLEYTLRKTVSVETVDIMDNSAIEIVRVMYDEKRQQFLIEIQNTGEVDVFVDLEIFDILINDQLETYGLEDVVFLKKGEKIIVPVDVPMDDVDFENNPRIKIRAYYGERERSLVNVIEGEYEYTMAGFGYLTGQMVKDLGGYAITYGPMLVIVILLLLILGMKKKCPNCNEINKLRAKRCKKCGSKI